MPLLDLHSLLQDHRFVFEMKISQKQSAWSQPVSLMQYPVEVHADEVKEHSLRL